MKTRAEVKLPAGRQTAAGRPERLAVVQLIAAVQMMEPATAALLIRAKIPELVRQPVAHLTTLAARAAALPIAVAPVAVRPMVMEAPAQVGAPTIAVPMMAQAQRTEAAQI